MPENLGAPNTGRMNFGVFLDSSIPMTISRPRGEVFKETLELVELVEELGFDGAWFPEHHFTVEGYDPVPLTMCAFAAKMTSRISIGTSILLLPLHHPLHVIEQAAVIDQVSGGRLQLGIGLGYREGEFGAFGISRKVRGQRMEEGLTVLMEYLKGRPFTYCGKHFQLRDVHPVLQPVNPPNFPVWVGARGPVAADRAGRFGRSLIVGGPEIAYSEYVQALEAHGYDPTTRSMAVHRTMHVASSEEQAWQRVGEALAYEGRVAREWYAGAADLSRDVHRPYTTVEEHRQVAKFIGDPDKVSRDIQELQGRYPGPVKLNWLLMNPRPACLELGVAKESLRLFAREVMPRFR